MNVNISEIFSSIQGEGRFAGHPAIFIRFAGCSVGCGFCDTKHAQQLDPERQLQTGSLQEYETHDTVKFAHWRQSTVQEVCKYVSELIEQSSTDKHKRIELIVITGGEPFEQPAALKELCIALEQIAEPEDSVSDGISIHIETSGTVPLYTNGTHPGGMKEKTEYSDAGHALQYIHETPWCFLTVSPKYKAVQLEYLEVADQLKFLVGHKPELDVKIPKEVLEAYAERDERLCFQPIWDDTDSTKTQMAIDRAIKMAYMHGGTVSTQVHKFLNIR